MAIHKRTQKPKRKTEWMNSWNSTNKPNGIQAKCKRGILIESTGIYGWQNKWLKNYTNRVNYTWFHFICEKARNRNRILLTLTHTHTFARWLACSLILTIHIVMLPSQHQYLYVCVWMYAVKPNKSRAKPYAYGKCNIRRILPNCLFLIKWGKCSKYQACV